MINSYNFIYVTNIYELLQSFKYKVVTKGIDISSRFKIAYHIIIMFSYFGIFAEFLNNKYLHMLTC